MTPVRHLLTFGLATLVAAQVAACGSDDRSQAPRSAANAAVPASTTPATTPQAPTPAPKPRAKRRTFAFTAQRLPGRVRQRVSGSSWHPGCPVTLEQLRYIQMSHWGFDRGVRRGVMIVNADAVTAVRSAFRTLFAKRFAIRRMRLVDDYGADDFASIEADNTSSFNCRRATGSTRWSQHAYGRAIDINPIENPYVYPNGTTSHPASRPYLDRSVRRPGMAREGGALVLAFDAVGWSWGGRWSPAVDLQHFSANGN